MSTDKSFGEWLRQHRRALDLTQEELARQVGCSAITLRKLEAEERKPSKQIAERLADVLHVPPDDRAAFLRFARGNPFAAGSSIAALADATAAGKPEPPRHNLPLQLTSFIGREKEIAEIGRLLSPPSASGVRLLTLTGPGGTGKTRLALHVVAGLAGIFRDGVWLIELAPLADPALVTPTVAAVLGLRDVSGRPVTDVLVDHLRSKQVLLVLDNCEHLIQVCAELAEKLLNTCPHLTILATSREALGVAGERPFPVSSLSTPDDSRSAPISALSKYEAVHLFVERASAVLPGFALDNRNALAVATICRQLDGNPLAIELAAARAQLLTVEQIANRLDDRFQLLTGGRRTMLPRHRTLAALIDWSYDLLSEPERVLLLRLAVFAGGWTLEAAEVVCGDDGLVVLDWLTSLVNKSLVVVERKPGQESRYDLLESIRQYALAKLAASGEADAARRQHAAYYLRLWDRSNVGLNGMEPWAWLDRAEMELDNLRAALTWSQSPLGNAELGLRLSVALSFLPVAVTEVRGWVEAALTRADAERADYPQARAAALNILGSLDCAQGDFASARAHLTRSMMLFQELGDKTSSAGVLERLGWVAREQGDAATARLRLAESLALYRELGDKAGVAGTLTTLGEVGVMQGEAAEAARLLNEALALNRELESSEGIGWSLNHLGHVAQLQGQYELAMQLHEESMPLFRKIHPEYHGVSDANQALGETALALGDATRATQHFREALDRFRFHGVLGRVAWCLAGLAGAAVLDEEPERAAQLWGAADALRVSIGARPSPAARATRERLMAAAREQLGDAAFDVAWAAGQAMRPEQAIELALDVGA